MLAWQKRHCRMQEHSATAWRLVVRSTGACGVDKLGLLCWSDDLNPCVINHMMSQLVTAVVLTRGTRCRLLQLSGDLRVYAAGVVTIKNRQWFCVTGAWTEDIIIIINIIINPLTARVVGAPQMILQPVFSIFPCSPLTSWAYRTPGLSIPWCCLPTSSSVCLVFFPLSLCFARWSWPDLMNGKHDHTTAVCVFLRSSGDLHVVKLPAGSWHGLPRW